MGITPAAVADEVEQALYRGAGVLGRDRIAALLRRAPLGALVDLLAADKKAGKAGELRMVLLTGIGAFEVRDVPEATWRTLWPAWKQGLRP
jgi:3-dehydroquinate synthase